MRRSVTREEICGQVWPVPNMLCEHYGSSDNGLMKVCRRLNVPVPPRGYWTKVGAGHEVRKAVLPKDAKIAATGMGHEPKRGKNAADEANVALLKEREELWRTGLALRIGADGARFMIPGGTPSGAGNDGAMRGLARLRSRPEGFTVALPVRHADGTAASFAPDRVACLFTLVGRFEAALTSNTGQASRPDMQWRPTGT